MADPKLHFWTCWIKTNGEYERGKGKKNGISRVFSHGLLNRNLYTSIQILICKTEQNNDIVPSGHKGEQDQPVKHSKGYK